MSPGSLTSPPPLHGGRKTPFPVEPSSSEIGTCHRTVPHSTSSIERELFRSGASFPSTVDFTDDDSQHVYAHPNSPGVGTEGWTDILQEETKRQQVDREGETASIYCELASSSGAEDDDEKVSISTLDAAEISGSIQSLLNHVDKITQPTPCSHFSESRSNKRDSYLQPVSGVSQSSGCHGTLISDAPRPITLAHRTEDVTSNRAVFRKTLRQDDDVWNEPDYARRHRSEEIIPENDSNTSSSSSEEIAKSVALPEERPCNVGIDDLNQIKKPFSNTKNPLGGSIPQDSQPASMRNIEEVALDEDAEEEFSDGTFEPLQAALQRAESLCLKWRSQFRNAQKEVQALRAAKLVQQREMLRNDSVQAALEAQIRFLREQVQKLRTCFEDKRIETERLQQEAKDAQDRERFSARLVTELRANQARQARLVEEREQEIDQQSQIIASLHVDMEQLKIAMEAERARVSCMEVTCNEYEEAAIARQREHVTLESKLVCMQTKLEHQTRQCANLEQEILAHNVKMEQLLAPRTPSHKDAPCLTTALFFSTARPSEGGLCASPTQAEIQQNAANVMEDMEHRRVEYRLRIFDLERELECSKCEAAIEIERRTAEVESLRNQLQTIVKNAEADAGVFEELMRCTVCTTVRESHERRLAEIVSEKHRLERSVLQLKRALAQREREVLSQEHQSRAIHDLERTVADLKTSVQIKAEEVQSLLSELNRHQRALEKSQSTREVLEERIRLMQSEETILRQRVGALEEELRVLTSRLRDRDQQLEYVQSTVHELRSEVCRANTALQLAETWKQEMAALSERNDEAQGLIQELRSEVHGESQQRLMLENEVRRLETECETVHKEKNGLALTLQKLGSYRDPETTSRLEVFQFEQELKRPPERSIEELLGSEDEWTFPATYTSSKTRRPAPVSDFKTMAKLHPGRVMNLQESRSAVPTESTLALVPDLETSNTIPPNPKPHATLLSPSNRTGLLCPLDVNAVSTKMGSGMGEKKREVPSGKQNIRTVPKHPTNSKEAAKRIASFAARTHTSSKATSGPQSTGSISKGMQGSRTVSNGGARNSAPKIRDKEKRNLCGIGKLRGAEEKCRTQTVCEQEWDPLVLDSTVTEVFGL